MPYLELNQSLWDEKDVHLAIYLQNDGKLYIMADDIENRR